MASRKISKTNGDLPTQAGVTRLNAGFTLIELLVVIGLLSIIGGLALILSMDSYRGYNFRSERDLLVVALYRARAEAINNMCFEAPGYPCTDGEPHGVHIEPNAFVVFQGSSYSASHPLNEVIPRQAAAVDVVGSDVIFSQLSANVGALTTFTLTEGLHTSSVVVGTEGQISWTN